MSIFSATPADRSGVQKMRNPSARRTAAREIVRAAVRKVDMRFDSGLLFVKFRPGIPDFFVSCTRFDRSCFRLFRHGGACCRRCSDEFSNTCCAAFSGLLSC